MSGHEYMSVSMIVRLDLETALLVGYFLFSILFVMNKHTINLFDLRVICFHCQGYRKKKTINMLFCQIKSMVKINRCNYLRRTFCDTGELYKLST